MANLVEAFGDDHDRKRDSKVGQAGNMAEAKIMGEEIAHVGAEDARDAQRRPITRA